MKFITLTKVGFRQGRHYAIPVEIRIDSITIYHKSSRGNYTVVHLLGDDCVNVKETHEQIKEAILHGSNS